MDAPHLPDAVARCFGLTLTEVGGVTNALDEWLGSLA